MVQAGSNRTSADADCVFAQTHAQVIHRDLKLENILLKGASPSTQDAKLSVRRVSQQRWELLKR